MTKNEAMLAINNGHKVAHRSFTKDEWMKKSCYGYKFENGILCTFKDFWYYRTDDSWLDGWHIVA